MQIGNPWMFGGHFPLGFRVPDLLRRPLQIVLGLAFLAALMLSIAALATWNVSDPSFSYATGEAPANVLGFGGAAFADVMM